MEQKERILNLVAAIQAGERDKLPALWDEVERLIKWWSNRLIVNMPGVDFNDLYQCGYIALATAVNTYKPVENASFTHWLAFYFKNEVAAFMGFRNKDPLRYAESLDAPLAEDSKKTLADTIPDSSELIEAADERIYRQQLRSALDKALSQLPELQERVIKRRFYADMSIISTAEAEGITPAEARKVEGQALKAIRSPKLSRELQQFIDEQTPFYMRVGISRFRTTGASAVEEIAIFRERLQERYASSDTSR